MFVESRVSTRAYQNPSQNAEDVRIRGQLPYSNRLLWQGSLGDIDADAFYAASTAITNGDITERSVTIDGSVLGSIVANKVLNSVTVLYGGQTYCWDVVVDDGENVNAKFTKEPVTNG